MAFLSNYASEPNSRLTKRLSSPRLAPHPSRMTRTDDDNGPYQHVYQARRLTDPRRNLQQSTCTFSFKLEKYCEINFYYSSLVKEIFSMIFGIILEGDTKPIRTTGRRFSPISIFLMFRRISLLLHSSRTPRTQRRQSFVPCPRRVSSRISKIFEIIPF